MTLHQVFFAALSIYFFVCPVAVVCLCFIIAGMKDSHERQFERWLEEKHYREKFPISSS